MVASILGTSKGDDWRGFIGIVRSRKSSILLSLLLVTIVLLTYSYHNTFNVDTGTYNTPQETLAEQPQQHQELPSSTSSEEPVVSELPSEPLGLDASEGESLSVEPSVTSTAPEPTQSSLAPGPLSTPLGGGIPLRVMFLGASVTRGDVSVGNKGFRSPLREKLAALGNPVNMVGSQRLGAFKDNDLEAYGGNRIDQVHEHATHIVASTKPNVFVIHVGSNDCLQRHDTGNAGKRMRKLIDYLLKTSPNATIIMSTLLTNTVLSKEACILDINLQIRRLASALMREGRHVVLAEMHYEQGLPDRPLPEHISVDGTHPFDYGYGLMAEIFFQAFVEADRRNFLQVPEENGIPDDGELERADEPLKFEPEPPKIRPPPPPPNNKDVPKKPEGDVKATEVPVKDGIALTQETKPKPEGDVKATEVQGKDGNVLTQETKPIQEVPVPVKVGNMAGNKEIPPGPAPDIRP